MVHYGHGQAGLSRAGATSNDDQVSLLEPSQQPVQVDEARGHPYGLPAMVVQVLDTIVVVGQYCPQGHQLPLDAALSHTEDELLGLIQDPVFIVGSLVRHARDLRRSADQSAQSGRPLHDAPIVLCVDRRGDHVDERSEIAGPSHMLQLPATLEFVTERHEIGRLALLVQVNDGPVDQAMGLAVEVVGAQERGDFEKGIRIDQQAAQDRLLGFYVLWRQPGCCHRRPTP